MYTAMFPRRFENRTIIITGGGTGMGRSAALRAAAEGANVVVAGRRSDEIRSVANEIGNMGGSALAVPTDVADEGQVKALVRTTLDSFGALHMAWNNAGILGGFKSLHESEMADVDQIMAINLRGTYACMKHQIAAMLELQISGAIVNTSSWTAHGAIAGTAAYAASKAALDALARTAALEVGPYGIRVNNVSPGVIATPMARAALGSEEAMQPFVRHTPLRRIGESEDVADAVLWLLSDDARFVTGQSIAVDGGFTIGGLRP